MDQKGEKETQTHKNDLANTRKGNATMWGAKTKHDLQGGGKQPRFLNDVQKFSPETKQLRHVK